MQLPQSYSVGGPRSSGKLTGRPAGACHNISILSLQLQSRPQLIGNYKKDLLPGVNCIIDELQVSQERQWC
ncbi:UNVERIFIED_CONTAM: hypothetical protein FKN15_030819 [Acipenser sinensis]